MFKMLTRLIIPVAILLQIHSIHGQPEVFVVVTPSQVVEGETFQACLHLTESPSLSAFMIAAQSTPETSAFSVPFLSYAIGQDVSGSLICVTFTAIEDDIVEGSETISLLTLTTTYNGVVTPNVMVGTLTIQDAGDSIADVQSTTTMPPEITTQGTTTESGMVADETTEMISTDGTDSVLQTTTSGPTFQTPGVDGLGESAGVTTAPVLSALTLLAVSLLAFVLC